MERGALAIILCVALLISGCGGDSPSTGPADATEADAEAREPGPTVDIPEGPPPKRLVVEDLKIGAGKPARAGDAVVVNYRGVHWGGERYSNSWTYPEPPDFVLGSGELIPGFDMGLRGMRAGGRRRLIVPPRLAFREGTDLSAANLRSGNTLVFVVHMLSVR